MSESSVKDAVSAAEWQLRVDLAVSGVAQAMKVQTEGLGGAFVWPALLRKLERIDPGYGN